jgi:DNA anti-recombination protein RmuC
MALKQNFAEQLKGQIAVWQGQINDYQERLGQASTQAQADYEKSIASLRDNTDQAAKLLGQVREASENAWKDMQASSEKALAQLQQGWAEALKRFQ